VHDNSRGAETYDQFRGIDGAFDATVRGFKELNRRGMSMQINTSIARHKGTQRAARPTSRI